MTSSIKKIKRTIKALVPESIQKVIEPVLYKGLQLQKKIIGKDGFDYGDEFKNHVCTNPFMYSEFMYEGGVHTCCYLRKPFGNIKEGGVMKAWNSEEAQKIRASILDGNYKYCDKRRCGAMQDLKLNDTKKPYPYRLIRKDKITDPYFKNIVDQHATVLTTPPKIMSMDNDPTCNLSCPSCRTKKIALNTDQRDRAEQQLKELMTTIHNDIEEMWFAGSGDVFASKVYRDFFENYEERRFPKAEFRIDTNGVLLTPRTWDTVLKKVQDKINTIAVSVDAATAKTYPTIRRDGNWEILMDNLTFISKLPQRKKGMKFWIRLIVQYKNFREMKKFVKLGKKLGVDSVIFSRISNWGTFTPKEYEHAAIHLADHPEHDEFVAVLKDPIFNDSIVDLGNLKNYHNALTQ